MGKVINLNRERKTRERATKEADAAANREKFGRTKARRKAEEAELVKLIRDLDGKKRDDPPDDGGKNRL
ncbi:MAG: DUF4169 family protein [Alphaproteobacteria bacterium]